MIRCRIVLVIALLLVASACSAEPDALTGTVVVDYGDPTAEAVGESTLQPTAPAASNGDPAANAPEPTAAPAQPATPAPQATPTAAPEPTATPEPTPEPVQSRAVAIELIEGDGRFSTRADDLTGPFGIITVHDASTLTAIDATAPELGTQFLGVDLEIVGIEYGFFTNASLRMLAGDRVYSPFEQQSEILGVAAVWNDTTVFQIPVEFDEVVLEAGAPEGERDGFTSRFRIQLAPAGAPEADPEPIIGWTTDIQLVSESAEFTTEPGDGGLGSLRVDRIISTDKIGAEAAREGYVFIIAEVHVVGIEYNNMLTPTFRLETLGERYPSITQVNELRGAGEVFNSELVFEVPAAARTVVLEAGAPPELTDGVRARYQAELVAQDPVVLPTTGPGVEAWEISQLTGGVVISTDQADGPENGSHEIRVVSASTTPKIEQVGAPEGFIFLVVEVELAALRFENVITGAFRVIAQDERYGPLADVNLLPDVGSVTNIQLTFEIPADTETVTFEAGTPVGLYDGLTAEFEIRLPSS